MRKMIVLSACVVAMQPASSMAAISLQIGSGNAVQRSDAAANFESRSALTDNPYVENGLMFTRTSLSFNNNGCGYAGCQLDFPMFSGNYMYGVGSNGYFEMTTVNRAVLSGLEFIVGNGYRTGTMTVNWTAFLQGTIVASGSRLVMNGAVVGVGGGDFDTVRYTDGADPAAPAFDSVRAQFAVSVVPELQTWAMMLVGMAGIAMAMRHRSRGTRRAAVLA